MFADVVIFTLDNEGKLGECVSILPGTYIFTDAVIENSLANANVLRLSSTWRLADSIATYSSPNLLGIYTDGIYISCSDGDKKVCVIVRHLRGA
jgi:hypothetical protein